MHLLPFRYLRCALKARKPHPPTLSHTRTKWVGEIGRAHV